MRETLSANTSRHDLDLRIVLDSVMELFLSWRTNHHIMEKTTTHENHAMELVVWWFVMTLDEYDILIAVSLDWLTINEY